MLLVVLLLLFEFVVELLWWLSAVLTEEDEDDDEDEDEETGYSIIELLEFVFDAELRDEFELLLAEGLEELFDGDCETELEPFNSCWW